MQSLCCYNTIFIFLLTSIVKSQPSTLIDVRIDHYKVNSIRDLVINTPRPRFSWKIQLLDNISQRNVQQTAYQMQLQSINISQRDQLFHWDSGHVISSQSIHVPYTGEYDLLSSTYYRFRIRVWITNSEESSKWTDWIRFRTPIFNLHEYLTANTSAVWIGSTRIYMNELGKEFTVPNTSPVKSAIVYISGIGYYELYVNGERVDPSRKLDPGGTTYEIRTLVVSFDLTSNITTGINAVGVKLGNGWFSQEMRRIPGYGPPRLLFTLLITFENGDTMEVVSDQTWTGRDGSIKYDGIYNGEIYDRRYDRDGWARTGFNDSLSAWITPEILLSPTNITGNGSLTLQDMPPIRAGLDALHFEVLPDRQQQGYLNTNDIGEIKGAKLTDGGILKPIAMWTSESGISIFDLGQNMAGWCRLKFSGSLGLNIITRHGEVLTQPVISSNHSTGNIYTENLNLATASDTYILRGDPINETYEPTFTFHGFRYLSVYDLHHVLSAKDVECPFVHSETTLKGHFVTSNPIVNQIQHNIQWGQLSNIMSWPSDCPQRVGRRAWLGDAALSVDEALYNFDLIKFYHNFLHLIIDVQRDDGTIPDYIPGTSYPADPNWGTALPTITWQVYRHYNDNQTLKDYYEHIVAYVGYLQNVYSKTGLVNFTVNWGDWVQPPPYPQTNGHLISSFAFLHDVYLLINISQILDKKNDTDTYSILYRRLAEEFHQVFFNSSLNYYADGMQAAQVLALALPDVVPTNVREAVINQLVNDINQKGNHVTTGIVATAQLYPILSDNGHHDLALELISSTTYPSYGYMFNNPYENATTLWEVWNAASSEPGMSSRNHIMFGSIGAWFYSHLAGIDLSSSNIITIRPRMASEVKKHLMSKLHCQSSTLYGVVEVSYTRHERDTVPNSVLLRVTIPPNAQGRVMFEPLFIGGQCKTLMESGKVIWSSDGSGRSVQEFEIEKDSRNGLMTVHIGSGEYEFHVLWK